MVANDYKNIDYLLEIYTGITEQTDTKAQLYREILSEVRELIYFMPQEIHGLHEEDCAEFMLDFESRLPHLIESYQVEQGNFKAYIYPIIKKNIQGFRKHRAVQVKKEESILFGHVVYELMDDSETPTEDLAVAEAMKSYGFEEDFATRRLKYLVANSEVARKRLYIYFISYAILMEEDLIAKNCSSFNFNLSETLKILSYINKQEINDEEKLNFAVNKRNEYFGKRLYVEKELSDNSQDDKNTPILQDRLDRYKNYFHYQETIIRRNQKKIPRTLVSKVLKLREGTIATSIYTTENLLEWCMCRNSIPDKPLRFLGVRKEILQLAQKEETIKSFNFSKVPIFNPIKSFGIDFVELND